MNQIIDPLSAVNFLLEKKNFIGYLVGNNININN